MAENNKLTTNELQQIFREVFRNEFGKCQVKFHFPQKRVKIWGVAESKVCCHWGASNCFEVGAY